MVVICTNLANELGHHFHGANHPRFAGMWLAGPWGLWTSPHLGIMKRKICKNDLCQRYGEDMWRLMWNPKAEGFDRREWGYGGWYGGDGCDSSESPVDRFENGGKHPMIYRLSTIPNWWCRISLAHPQYDGMMVLSIINPWWGPGHSC